jgi:hypothetical protein
MAKIYFEANLKYSNQASLISNSIYMESIRRIFNLLVWSWTTFVRRGNNRSIDGLGLREQLGNRCEWLRFGSLDELDHSIGGISLHQCFHADIRNLETMQWPSLITPCVYALTCLEFRFLHCTPCGLLALCLCLCVSFSPPASLHIPHSPHLSLPRTIVQSLVVVGIITGYGGCRAAEAVRLWRLSVLKVWHIIETARY